METEQKPKHAYAEEVLEIEVAMHSLNHISGHRIPMLAAVALDEAYRELGRAKKALDAFEHDER